MLLLALVAEAQIVSGVRAAPPTAYDFGSEPMRYLENARLKLGINLETGGAVTYLEDKLSKSGNMINQRLDRAQYPARNQEMPAPYTTGPWYRLVTASGDAPFTGAPLTTVVGKDDAKGWPRSTFHASEHWAALVNDDNRGVGLFQADTCTMSGVFAGGDALKGTGGPKDMQTGYLSPVAKRILDSNIDMTDQTDIIVGSLDEIRAYARKQLRHGLSWRFASDRQGPELPRGHETTPTAVSTRGWDRRSPPDHIFPLDRKHQRIPNMKQSIQIPASTRIASPTTRRRFCGTLAAGTLGAAMSPVRMFAQTVVGVRDGNGLVKPTPQQLAWQDLELGLFIHFDMVTFTGQMKPPTPDAVDRYNPTKLDTDQWLEVAKSMGAKYAVFVAKHCTAFLSWQSNAYPYGVKQTAWRGGKGDVVRDFIASCKKYDIKPGLYASAGYPEWWGSDNPGAHNPALIPWAKKTQKDWNKACGIMLRELWTNYGELTEIWFDGGVVPVAQGGPDLIPIMQKHQSKAIVFGSPAPGGIRWSGNEVGLAPYPCWSTIKNFGDNLGGDGDGRFWTPAECDSTLPGHDWFWGGGDPSAKPNEESQQKMLAELMDKYCHSVGHNANLLLNATPDTTGLIPDAILPHYANFGKEIRRRFDQPVAETKGGGDTVELVLKQPARIDHVLIMEDLAQGERIRAYEVEGLVPGNTWQKLCDGVSIGHKRIQQFKRTEVAKIRLRATKAIAPPKIRRLAVFNVV